MAAGHIVIKKAHKWRGSYNFPYFDHQSISIQLITTFLQSRHQYPAIYLSSKLHFEVVCTGDDYTELQRSVDTYLSLIVKNSNREV